MLGRVAGMLDDVCLKFFWLENVLISIKHKNVIISIGFGFRQLKTATLRINFPHMSGPQCIGL